MFLKIYLFLIFISLNTFYGFYKEELYYLYKYENALLIKTAIKFFN